MLLEMSGEVTPERVKGWSQSKINTQLWMWLVIEARSDAIKSNIAYEPEMLVPWIKANWKWSNRRCQEWMNINILGISELKWTGMGEFNSDDHYIYYCRQESLRRNRVAIIANKRLWNAVFGCNLKSDRIISVHFQGKPFRVIQVYALTSNAEEAEVEWFYEDLQDLLQLTPPKYVIFIIDDWNAKVGSQEILGVTSKIGLAVQNEAGQRLVEFCQKNALVIANTLFQQHKRRLYTWTSPDGQHRNQIDYILCSQRWRSSISKNKTGSWLWLRSWTPYCQIETSIEESGENH